MPLIITELAILSDGTYVVEIANTDLTAYDVSGLSLIFETATNPGQFGTTFTNLGIASLAPGQIVTLGQSTNPDVDISNLTFDQIFDPPSLGVAIAGIYIRESAGSFANIDHFGLRAGPDLGTDVVYAGTLDRTAKTDRDTDNTLDFTQSSPYSSTGFGTALCLAAGTLIATGGKETAVETLSIGDMVRAADGRDVPVKWIGRQTVQKAIAGEKAELVKISAHALGNHTDLY